jgi:hypothetical protein
VFDVRTGALMEGPPLRELDEQAPVAEPEEAPAAEPEEAPQRGDWRLAVVSAAAALALATVLLAHWLHRRAESSKGGAGPKNATS